MNSTHEIQSPASLDPETIARLRELAQETDPTLFAEILVTFRDDLSQYLASIRQAVLERDVTALKHCAHAMKGASMNTGALSLAEISERLEDAAGTGNLVVVPPLMAGLEDEVQRVIADIELELSAAA